MHCAAMAQITDHGNFKAINIAASVGHFFANGVEIKQCLGWMFIGAVTAIHHWHPTGRGKVSDRTLLGMAHANHIAKPG